MRLPLLGLACTALLALAACGDDKPEERLLGGGGPGKSGKALTRAELEEALRSNSSLEGAQAELARQMAEAGNVVKEHLGTSDFAESARRAAELGGRALTPADVETYLAVAPKLRGSNGAQAETVKLLQGHGLGVLEWTALHMRITAARMAIKQPAGKHDAKFASDVETVRPFADRIDAAAKGK